MNSTTTTTTKRNCLTSSSSSFVFLISQCFFLLFCYLDWVLFHYYDCYFRLNWYYWIIWCCLFMFNKLLIIIIILVNLSTKVLCIPLPHPASNFILHWSSLGVCHLLYEFLWLCNFDESGASSIKYQIQLLYLNKYCNYHYYYYL